MTTSSNPEVLQEHSRDNCWFNGKEWIPIENLTEEHLRSAKLFAQRKEEIFHRKCSQWSELVDKLDNEGERRGIEMPTVKSRYHKNNRVLKDAIKRE